MLVVKPIQSEMYNSRCQIDLVDMQSMSIEYDNKEYRFILNCQDHLTKFVHLRPLTGKLKLLNY